MTPADPPDGADLSFGDAIGPVRPLRTKKVVAAPGRPTRPARQGAPATPVVPVAPPAPIDPRARLDAATAVCLRRPGVQDRAMRALRGRAFRAQDECDLHGLTAAAAAVVLDDFLADAAARGLSRVRVIHGRGQGVLRNLCVVRLGEHPAVLAAVSAGPADGGLGALRVLLRAGRTGGAVSPGGEA